MQNSKYSTEGTCGRQYWGQQGGCSSPNTQHLINHLPLLFAAQISSIHSNHHNKNSNSLQEKNMHQETNQIAGQANASQFGFRTDHSMMLQCMRLADHVTLNFNNNMSTAAVFFGY
jgi:hypothetical protein